jgi:serine protease inhibitor
MIDVQRLVAAFTRFGFKVFAKIIEKEGGNNIFISPYSVAAALAMTYNGAGGETQEAMARTLELHSMSLQEVNLAHAALREAIENADTEIQLDIANSLWADISEDFKPDFLQRTSRFYDAEVTKIDFNDSAAASLINAWVRKKTRHKIDEIIKEINPLMVCILINAIYFKGKWAEKFDREETKEGTFTLLNGKKKKAPMMYQEGNYRYLRGEKFQAVSLPYGRGRLCMYIFLPDGGYNFAKFQERLTTDNWERWMEQFQETPGSIVLPRFKVEYEKRLKDALTAMGVEVAFDVKRANFMGIRPSLTSISEVIHKTFLDVNEEGTEAAAVAEVEFVTIMGIPEPSSFFSMVVDRPFLCAIRDDETGAMLFMGSIIDPIIGEEETTLDRLKIMVECIYPLIGPIKSFSLKSGEEKTLGRSDLKGDIKGIEKISRKHFSLALSKSGTGVIVTDTSKRGILVNYIKVNKNEPRVCKLPVTISLAGVAKLRLKQV